MDGRIGHLHCDYRMLGNPASKDRLVARLQQLAQQQLAASYATALDQALGDDPAIYVLRQVDFDVGLFVNVAVTDTQLAQRWGERMAGAVMERIAAESTATIWRRGHTQNATPQVVRFADQAEYVARFLADLAQGEAWNCWYYSPFAAHRTRDLQQIVRMVLDENRDHLPAILSYLKRYGTLGALLAKLDPLTQCWLWSLVRMDRGADQAAFSSLLAVAVRLVDQLDLWAGPHPDNDTLLLAYLTTRPSSPDWRDRTGLATALLSILRFLVVHGYVCPSWVAPGEPGEPVQALAAYLSTHPPPPDWRNQNELRVALFDSMRFLAAQGCFRLPYATLEELDRMWSVGGEVSAESFKAWWQTYGAQVAADLAQRLADMQGKAPFLAAQTTRQRYQNFLDRLRQALKGLDWLNTTWLQAAFTRMLREIYPIGTETDNAQMDWPAQETQAGISGARQPIGISSSAGLKDQSRPALPLRPAGSSPTPRQRELLESLLAVIRAGVPGLDFGRPAAPANALRLYAAFIERFPTWAGDALATEMIQRLLAAWAWILRARSPAEVLHRLRECNVEAALRALAEQDRSLTAMIYQPSTDLAGTSAVSALQFVAELGQPALAVVETLTARAGTTVAIAGEGIETQCAGIAMLLRAILDMRLPNLVEQANSPEPGVLTVTPFQSLLLALCLRWAGRDGAQQGQIDRGLLLLAGLDAGGAQDDRLGVKTLAAFRNHWSSKEATNLTLFQTAWLQTLVNHHMLGGPTLHLHRLAMDDGASAWVAGDARTSVWPLGRVVAPDGPPDCFPAWLEASSAALGSEVNFAAAKESGWPVKEGQDRLSLIDTTAGDELAVTHVASREQLMTSLSDLKHGRLELPQADLTIALTAISLLRLWARWLRSFSNSSVRYLLENFIRRPGRLYIDQDEIVVELEPKPLDMVLQMAGYLEPIQHVPWLGQRRVRFERRG